MYIDTIIDTKYRFPGKGGVFVLYGHFYCFCSNYNQRLAENDSIEQNDHLSLERNIRFRRLINFSIDLASKGNVYASVT